MKCSGGYYLERNPRAITQGATVNCLLGNVSWYSAHLLRHPAVRRSASWKLPGRDTALGTAAVTL